MIIYGVLGDVSVLKLFTAGFIPGFLLAGCFMAWIMIHTALKPSLIPEGERSLGNLTFLDRIKALKELAPAMFLIGAVLGSMYGGIATPSESAAVGVLGALIVAALQGQDRIAQRCQSMALAVRQFALLPLDTPNAVYDEIWSTLVLDELRVPNLSGVAANAEHGDIELF